MNSEWPTTREGTDSIWEAMYTQRAIRRWEDRPVPREVLWRVLEAATRAPSGSNLQPWRFVVIQDPGTKSEVAGAIRALFEGNERFRAFVEQGMKSQNRSERLMLEGAYRLFTALDLAPVLIIPCLFGLASPTADPNSLLAGSSIYGAVQNLLLAARAVGLGGVLTTIHGGVEPQLRQILGLPDAAKPVALIPMGYPAGNFGPTNRRPVEEVAYWDGWGRTAEKEA